MVQEFIHTRRATRAITKPSVRWASRQRRRRSITNNFEKVVLIKSVIPIKAELIPIKKMSFVKILTYGIFRKFCETGIMEANGLAGRREPDASFFKQKLLQNVPKNEFSKF